MHLLTIAAPTHSYYISAGGDDSNPGSLHAPFRTIDKLNDLHLTAGDAVYFKAGETFAGRLIIKSAGKPGRPILISSFGKGSAFINAGNGNAVSVLKAAYICVSNLRLIGNGRKTGNIQNGLAILNSEHIKALDLEISGFQKSGLLIDSSSNILAGQIFAHDNGSAGITVEGAVKKSSRNIVIRYSRAENNPGDPTKMDNHSGNGIVAGHCTRVLIEHCTATNNGWDMPRIGNGPVGIWCYEADSVTIQYCLSYRNKTAKGAADGGGFDLDGGVTNSVIQYCFSYGNQGSGYCAFQYDGASPWHNNVIRYNITENDGTVSDSKAGIYIWNSSGDPRQFYNCKIYGNIVYNDQVAAISFSDQSESSGFYFFNNIFAGKDSLIRGRDKLGTCRFTGNNWWSLTAGFEIWGERNFNTWALKYGQEQQNGKIIGLNFKPPFKRPGKTMITCQAQVAGFDGYDLPGGSRLNKLLKKNRPGR